MTDNPTKQDNADVDDDNQPTPIRVNKDGTRDDSELRYKIKKQFVLSRMPGYKMTRGDLHDEMSRIPDVYVDNVLTLMAQWEREARNNADQEGYHRGVSDFSRWFMDASNPGQRQLILPDVARDLHDNYRPPIIFPSAHMFDAPLQPLNNKGEK